MRNYAPDDWARLGQAVFEARSESGLSKTTDWVAQVGRSSRILLGLERGEQTGSGTLERIEDALGWPRGSTHRLLAGGVTDWRDLAVGGDGHTSPGYVSAPGERVESGASDSEVLRAIEQMREDVRAMERRLSERLDRLEGEGS